RRRRSMEGVNPSPSQRFRSDPLGKRTPTTDERVSSFLAHYFRRRSPSGDSRRILSGGERERPQQMTRSAKTAR
ncbi:hypothetical protein PMAYCL1PPCAC_07805, partial [Pristionchus mayeri]